MSGCPKRFYTTIVHLARRDPAASGTPKNRSTLGLPAPRQRNGSSCREPASRRAPGCWNTPVALSEAFPTRVVESASFAETCLPCVAVLYQVSVAFVADRLTSSDEGEIAYNREPGLKAMDHAQKTTARATVASPDKLALVALACSRRLARSRRPSGRAFCASRLSRSRGAARGGSAFG